MPPLPPPDEQPVPYEPGRDAAAPGDATGTPAVVQLPENPQPAAPPGPLPPLEPYPEETPGPDAAMAGRPPAEPLPPDPREKPDGWLDASHAAVERLLFKPVIEFDRFFSDERELDAERARSFLRVRSEIEVTQHGPPRVGASLRASLRFPGMGEWMERFRLVVNGDTEDTSAALFPEDATAVRSRDARRANAELRLGAWRDLLSSIDLGTGVLLTVPPGVFVRARYRATLPVTELFLTKFGTSVYWQSDTGPGTRMDLDLERTFGESTLLRLAGSGDVNQRATRGVEFGSELALLHALGPRRAVQVAGALEGASDSPAPIDRYRAYVRYRQDLFRRWFFVELEPEVFWPWAPIQAYHTTYGATFRLEVQFQGVEPD
ncbi:MAG: hypothetical protein QM767_17135 [Anaeromyxobacter sp.]